MTDGQLAVGTYEVLRKRLSDAASSLRERIARLNHDRSEVFGNIDTVLLATERVTTEHNCIPRDLVAMGDRFLFGYNVQFGLKTDIRLADVFSAYRFQDRQFHETDLDLIGDERFDSDFHELYRFYKDTRFARFFRQGPMLHMVFQIGKSERDIKSFKWRIDSDRIEYLDNRSEHEVRDPPQHEFRWTRTTRDQHRYGAHPHISIDDRVFVETVGGDLTIKVENNTDSGAGVYAEPVENADQTLDDAEIEYAIVGNLVLLKIRPYQEQQVRYLVFNGKTSSALRLDDIAHSCVMLPSDQGVIFPGGYYLQTGEFKKFDHGLSGMRYQRTIAASNGEDYLYLFYNRSCGTYIQLQYNVISQTVDTPLICHGQTWFDGGEMVCFKAQEQPEKHHAIQIWQTPFTSGDQIASVHNDSFLFKIGNKEIVRGMAECSEILQLIEKDDNYDGLYVDLVKKASDVIDSYFWIGDAQAHALAEPLEKIRETANAAIEEFEKVVRVRRSTSDRSKEVRSAVEMLIQKIKRDRFDAIDQFVGALSELRLQRGNVLALRDLKYVDLSIVEQLEHSVIEQADRLSRRCVDFLLHPESLDPYTQQIDQAGERATAITTVADAAKLDGVIDETASQLELLTETISNLKIDDATQRTEIIDSISNVFASLNRVRSSLKARRSELIGSEGKAEFASQLKLLQQTTAGYLDVSDTPSRCDEYLTKIMVQVEELEGRFAEFDDFVIQLAQRREGIYETFESRKVQLIEKRNQRAESLAAAGSRILQGIEARVGKLESTEAIGAYFASDLMIAKVRDIIEQLDDLDDAVRVEDLSSRLKTIREDSTRQLRDRQDLYEDGGDLIRLGDHRFAVNTQPLDLTTVLRDGSLNLHLTGTQYFRPLDDEPLLAAKDLWNQDLVSESDIVYRGEYLAVDLFDRMSSSEASSRASFEHAGEIDVAWVQREIADRYDEGYAKGVHDADAATILAALLRMNDELGLLKHAPSVRAAAALWFTKLLDTKTRKAMTDWIHGFARLANLYPHARPAIQFRERLTELADESADQWQPIFDQKVRSDDVAAYLFDELTHRPQKMVVSSVAIKLFEEFSIAIAASKQGGKSVVDTLKLVTDPVRAYILARNWADAFLKKRHADDELDPAIGYRDELAWVILAGGGHQMKCSDATAAIRVSGLFGDHRRIESGTMIVHYHELLHRVGSYRRDVVPRYQQLRKQKMKIVDCAREEMRLSEFRPRVLTSFVRNRLLDEVYLPLIGDNLAKQLGAAGENKRTDRMGLLLLISPPGYGKTTLMEYVANRLGLVFMKINGPAIGHAVTSLDPAEAPNAAAREEIQRLNLALEMGDNIMIYIDDIQHTNPEFLQKFISLCDATRKIEGVHNGRTRTYDLRGRRVAVVMAGNPYTESGERFQVPDMLSNRADVYNLGEIIGDSVTAFESSYLENCLTSNPTLAPLTTAPVDDARKLIKAAERDSLDGVEFVANWSTDQQQEMFEVMRKLLRVRDVVLKVNRAYIHSAAQADAYRTEPPFKLQGSYRNMNRIAERVAPVMNDQELQSLIVGAYLQDAQTLTTENEANVLKFKELLGSLTSTEQQRWDAIKYAYVESVRMAGMDSEDQVGQLMRQLASVRDGLESIRQVIAHAIAVGSNGAEQRMDARVDSIRQSLASTGSELAETLRSTSQQLEQISHQRALQPPEQRILVQHKVPRVLADLVRGQFHLMQEWLRPILAESQDNSRDLDRLRQKLDEMLTTYQAVEDSFESVVEKKTET